MGTFDKSEFDSVYRLMKISFPEDERRPYKEQMALLDRTEYKIHVLKNNDGSDICAFAAIWDFERFVFVEHFAVSPSCRNAGVGSGMIKRLASKSGKPVCLEVEPPTNEITARRIAFYERNGFFLNDYPYVQPPISKTRRPVPLMIMTTDRKITPEEFDSVKNTLYKNVYNEA